MGEALHPPRVPALSRDPWLPRTLGPGSAAHHLAGASCCAAHGTRHPSRRDLAARFRPSFANSLLLSRSRGRRECRVRAAPAVSCAKSCAIGAHEHTGQRKHSDIPCAMALRLTSCSPRRRIPFVTVVSRIDGYAEPVGPDITSADLTSATDARTTRLRRTQLPPPILRQAVCGLPKFWQKH